MNRRQYLRAAAAGASGLALGTAGCQGISGGDAGDENENPNTKLPKPELEADPEALAYPAWGQQLPQVTVPAALADREVTTTGIGTPLALTFVFTSCLDVCPGLTQALKGAHDRAIEDGWADAVTFAEFTFDPARDTPERFAEYADEQNVDLSAGNWYFLRPESEERAEEVVAGEFGVAFEKQDPEEAEGEGHDHEGGGYQFIHPSLVLLANAEGYVERTYLSGGEAAANLPGDMDDLRQA